MTEKNQNQSASGWTSISREDLKNAEIKSLTKRRNRKLRYLGTGLLLAAACGFLVNHSLSKTEDQKAAPAQTELARETTSETETAMSNLPDVALSTSGDDALSWSYGEGFCGISMFETAMKQGDTAFDLSALPTKEEILKAKLESYGYPYVMDGERFFIFYFQDHDQDWSQMEHGESTMEKSGCGTVCLSMVLTSMTGDIESYTPAKIAQFMVDEHIAAPNESDNSIPVTNRCLNTGLEIKKYENDLDLDLVDETLEKGGYIIIDQFKYTSSEIANVFAARNHYMVIRGGNQEDGYYIANPLWAYSSDGSEVRYAPQNYTQIPAEMFHAFYYYTVLPGDED